MTNPDFQFIRDMDTFTFEIAEGFLRESCFVTFEATKSLHTQCTITVKEKPIKWEDRLPDLRVREGREIVLPCKLSRPDVPCEWYFNEDPIENNKRTKIAHNFFKHQLTIHVWSKECLGLFDCPLRSVCANLLVIKSWKTGREIQMKASALSGFSFFP